jgi:hypothetical protein
VFTFIFGLYHLLEHPEIYQGVILADGIVAHIFCCIGLGVSLWLIINVLSATKLKTGEERWKEYEKSIKR